MSKGQTLQDPFLNALRKDRIPVSIFLVNGIKLQGQIESFDQYVVLLKNTVSQMVYKHAISTIVPVRNPRPSDATGAGYQGGSNNYPMGGGASFGGGYERPSGGFTRGGFTRTPPNTGYDRSGGNFGGGYQGQGFNTGGSFERSNYDERGFDGKTFERQDKSFDSRGFGEKPFPSDDSDD